MSEQYSQSYLRQLRRLRAVRQFRPDPISQQIIDDILDVARWTGSARNIQPWEIIVVQQRETLHALATVEGYAGHLAGAALGAVLVMTGVEAEQETYDEGRLSERMMLAAATYGIGSSIGWFNKDGPDEVKRLLGIPAQRRVRTAISFGYPDDARLRRRGPGRKPLADIVKHERYS